MQTIIPVADTVTITASMPPNWRGYVAQKFNPNHDELGRFAEAPYGDDAGGGGAAVAELPPPRYPGVVVAPTPLPPSFRNGMKGFYRDGQYYGADADKVVHEDIAQHLPDVPPRDFDHGFTAAALRGGYVRIEEQAGSLYLNTAQRSGAKRDLLHVLDDYKFHDLGYVVVDVVHGPGLEGNSVEAIRAKVNGLLNEYGSGPIGGSGGRWKRDRRAWIARKFNPNHAPAGSPEGGQFTSGDGGGGSVSSPMPLMPRIGNTDPSYEYPVAWEKLQGLMKNSGFNLGTIASLPVAIQEGSTGLGALHNPTLGTEKSVQMAQGVLDAFEQAPKDFANDLKRDVTVVFANCDRTSTIMATVHAANLPSEAFLIVNTGYIDELTGIQHAPRIFADWASSPREFYKIAALHEMGHLIDGQTNGALTRTVIRAAPEEDNDDQRPWRAWVEKVRQNVSDYATFSAPETAGELTAMHFVGRKLPAGFETVAAFLDSHAPRHMAGGHA